MQVLDERDFLDRAYTKNQTSDVLTLTKGHNFQKKYFDTTL